MVLRLSGHTQQPSSQERRKYVWLMFTVLNTFLMGITLILLITGQYALSLVTAVLGTINAIIFTVYFFIEYLSEKKSNS